jgi:hypothetical protein
MAEIAGDFHIRIEVNTTVLFQSPQPYIIADKSIFPGGIGCTDILGGSDIEGCFIPKHNLVIRKVLSPGFHQFSAVFR